MELSDSPGSQELCKKVARVEAENNRLIAMNEILVTENKYWKDKSSSSQRQVHHLSAALAHLAKALHPEQAIKEESH